MNIDITEKISQIEEEIRKTPYHKGTEHHIGKLKARAAKLKEELFQKNLKSSGGGGGQGYAIKKTGDASVVLVGPPSVGKSTLINRLTNANSKVAAYDFTTIGVIPGMMDYRGAKIQILDVPGIITGAAQGKGRGKEVLSVVRAADLIIIMVDNKTSGKIELIKKELDQFGIRLDQLKPKVFINKQSSGGIKATTSVELSHFSLDTVKEIAPEFKIRNGEIVIKEDISLDQLIDSFMGNCCYLSYLVVVNKADLINKSEIQESSYLYISAVKGFGLKKLKEKIWEKLDLMRLYLKPVKGKPDFNHPLIIKNNLNLKKILDGLNFEDKELIKKAKIDGPGAKFPGQEVSLSFIPSDETIVNFLT